MRPSHKQLLQLAWAVVLGCGLAACQKEYEGEVPPGYRVTVRGAPSRAIRNTLLAVSDCNRYRAKPPPTLALLQERARRDLATMQTALRAYGYYEAAISNRIEQAPRQVRVNFYVTPGRPFRMDAVVYTAASNATLAGVQLPAPDALGLAVGEPVRGKPIVDAAALLAYAMATQGYPFGRVAQRQVRADFSQATVRVEYQLDPGPRLVFGALKVEGLQRLQRSYVEALISWKMGAPYNAAAVDHTRDVLMRSGLFSFLNIAPALAPESGNKLPMVMRTRERRHRTVGLGGGYSTDQGFGVQGSWENRNLFGRAERLQLRAEVSESLDTGMVTYEVPQFWKPMQSLAWEARLADDKPSVYHSRYVRAAVSLKQRWTRKTGTAFGPAVKLSDVTQLGQEDSYLLLAFPMQATYDSRDSLLDPNRGMDVAAQAAPYMDVFDNSPSFTRTKIAVAQYFNVLEKPFITLAGRAAVGSLWGAKSESVPADERFYAGGGGSIRGYAYETVGPVESNQCVGGNALLEVSVEARCRVTTDLGLVVFMDGGMSYKSDFPDNSEQIRWGAGCGLRYYTAIGPIRGDIGFPLNRRPGMDEAYQVYISIGQAY